MSKHVRLFLIFLSLTSLFACSSEEAAAPAGGMVFPPVPVQISQAVEEPVPIEVQVVGAAEPFASVEVKSQVAGPLLNVRFREGANVQRGDLLFEIDPRPYQEALRQAEAEAAKSSAQLRQAQATLARNQAQLKNSQTEAQRIERLTTEGVFPRQQQDTARTSVEVAEQSVHASEAEIESLRAGVESSNSAVERARLNLGYTQIRAPLSGRVGNLLLHPGNLVSANGDDPLVVINQVSPIFVTFGVPAKYLTVIREKSVGSSLRVEAIPDKTSEQRIVGTLSVIDNTVDPNTGLILLKAVFDNPGGVLWPGQFVNVNLRLDTQTATTIPAQSVQVGQQGSFIYVVKADKTVEARPVTVGPTVAGKVIIEQGVTAGETVVTDGQSRLFPGATIQESSQSSPAPAGS